MLSPRRQPGFLVMTPISIDASSPRTADLRVIGLVGSAHFVSHIYILILPPVFPFVRAEFGVSYTQLGFVVAVFNIVSALLQTPAGFLVDRTSGRLVLVGGLLLGAASLVAAASAPAFLLLGVAFAFLGLANTVYHPADYALLSNRVSPGRVGQAFSIHIFAGFIGTAITPAAMVILASTLGWRGAFLIAAGLGVAVAGAILAFGAPLGGREAARAKAADATAPSAGDWRVLATWPVIAQSGVLHADRGVCRRHPELRHRGAAKRCGAPRCRCRPPRSRSI